MFAYALRRLLLIIPTLFGIMVVNFFIIQTAPGGPVEQMIAKITGTAVEATAEGARVLDFRIDMQGLRVNVESDHDPAG